jgi:hypothetical protein
MSARRKAITAACAGFMCSLPKTVAYILRDWRQAQNELKGFLGD